MKWLVLVAACSAPPDCKELLTTRLVDIPERGFSKACASRFAPACAHALEGEPDGDAIFAACTRAYATIDPAMPRADWFATAIDRRGLSDRERRDLGMALDMELRPRGVTVRLHPDAIEIAGASYPPSATAEIEAALRSQGAARGGVLVWGVHDAPAAYDALAKVLRAGKFDTVMCTKENCR